MSNSIVRFFSLLTALMSFKAFHINILPSIPRFSVIWPDDMEVSAPERHDQLSRNATPRTHGHGFVDISFQYSNQQWDQAQFVQRSNFKNVSRAEPTGGDDPVLSPLPEPGW